VLLAIATYGVGVGEPTSNVARKLLKSAASKDLTTLFACLSGCLTGLAISLTLLARKDGLRRVLLSALFIAATASAIGSLAGFSKSPELNATVTAGDVSAVAGDVDVEQIHETSFYPIRVAARGKDVFFAGVSDVIGWQGVIVKLSYREDGSGYDEQVIARGVDRPCGIAVVGDRILVSRSGQWHRADDGELKPQSTGTVSELIDLDGDGVIDHVNDLMEELPGARSPETQHQNSAIAVGDDGRIYVGQGVRTDDSFDPDKWAGTVIVADGDGSNMKVFASGFRNPFGLCFGPYGKLYCTDNDPDRNQNGEELNLVSANANYGFPMVHGDAQPPKGTVAPIGVYHHGDLQGMTYNDSPSLPDQYRNCLYIASIGGGKILRAQIQREEPEGDLTAEFFEFANIPNPLDVTASDDGTMYASSFSDRKIYKIKCKSR